jgi:hypothetical protein
VGASEMEGPSARRPAPVLNAGFGRQLSGIGGLARTTTTEAAPPFAIFEGWVPRTTASDDFVCRNVGFPRNEWVRGERMNLGVEVGDAHLPKISEGGAASVVRAQAINSKVGQPPFYN